MNEPNSCNGLPLPTQTPPPEPADGGPAFPRAEVLHPLTGNPWDYGFQGMSLRDWFAGQASEDDIAEFMPQTQGDCWMFEEQHGFEPTRAWAKYQYADAMLKARAQ